MPPQTNSPHLWHVGEHIAIVGDTGTGKTFLENRILQLREYVVFLRTKSDATRIEGFTKALTADRMKRQNVSRILLEPKYEHQAHEGFLMLEHAWVMGGWTVAVDEYWYVERIGLQRPVERLLTQGRSKGISVVLGMQRPVQVSRFGISQCTHLFCFRIDNRDLKTIRDATNDGYADTVRDLRKYEYAYFNRADRSIRRGYAQTLDTILVKRRDSAGKGLTAVR